MISIQINIILENRVTRYLEPLAIAANITQASFCRMDQVLLTFGYLILQYAQPVMADDPIARDAIINSIEKRWSKADQELFIASVLINPFYRSAPFTEHHTFSYAGQRSLFSRLWTRFNNSTGTLLPPSEFLSQADDFIRGSGTYSELQREIDDEMSTAHSSVSFNYLLPTIGCSLNYRNGSQIPLLLSTNSSSQIVLPHSLTFFVITFYLSLQTQHRASVYLAFSEIFSANSDPVLLIRLLMISVR